MTKRFALCFLLAACGTKVPGAGGDGGIVGGDEPDGGTLPQPIGNTQVLVYSSGTPLEGAKVVFHGPGGASTSVSTTNADGRAAGDLQAGGAVTVAVGAPPDFYELTTISGLNPGASLVFGSPPVPSVDVSGMATVTLPAPFPDSALTRLDLGCTTVVMPDATQTVNLNASCLDGHGTLDFLAEAQGLDGQPMAYTAAKGIPLSSGSAILTLPSWVPADSYTVTATGATAADVTSLDLETRFLVDGLSFTGPRQFASIEDARAGVHLARPSGGFADGVSLITSVERTTADGVNSSTRIAALGQPPSGAYTVDLGMLPPVLGGLVVGAPEPARPAVAWMTTTPVAANAVARARISWMQGDFGHSWTLIGPAPTTASGSLATPPLPAEMSGYAPSQASTALKVDVVTIIASTYFSSYGDFITKFKGLTETIGTGRLPSAGTVWTTESIRF